MPLVEFIEQQRRTHAIAVIINCRSNTPSVTNRIRVFADVQFSNRIGNPPHPELHPEFLRHARCQQPRGQPARLQDHHLPVPSNPC